MPVGFKRMIAQFDKTVDPAIVKSQLETAWIQGQIQFRFLKVTPDESSASSDWVTAHYQIPDAQVNSARMIAKSIVGLRLYVDADMPALNEPLTILSCDPTAGLSGLSIPTGFEASKELISILLSSANPASPDGADGGGNLALGGEYAAWTYFPGASNPMPSIYSGSIVQFLVEAQGAITTGIDFSIGNNDLKVKLAGGSEIGIKLQNPINIVIPASTTYSTMSQVQFTMWLDEHYQAYPRLVAFTPGSCATPGKFSVEVKCGNFGFSAVTLISSPQDMKMTAFYTFKDAQLWGRL